MPGEGRVRGHPLARLDRLVSVCLMRVALLQLNPTVGDLEGNVADRRRGPGGGRFCRSVRHVGDGADRLSGADLLLQPGIHRARRRGGGGARSPADGAVARARRHARPPIPPTHGRPLFNSAALLRGWTRRTPLPQVAAAHLRRLRRRPLLRARRRAGGVDIGGRRCAVSVCEDVWNDPDFWRRPRYERDPIETCAGRTRTCCLNLSASPFAVGKQRRARADARPASRANIRVRRLRQPGRRQRRAGLRRPQRGDHARRRAVTRAPPRSNRRPARRPPESGAGVSAPRRSPAARVAEEEIFRALVLGTRDYARSAASRRRCSGSPAASTRRSPL